MRILMAITALFIFTSFASADQVIDGVSYNFNPVDYNAVDDCNKKDAEHVCAPFGEGHDSAVGQGPDAGGEGEGEGDGGKH